LFSIDPEGINFNAGVAPGTKNMKTSMLLAAVTGIAMLAGSASATITYDFSGNFNSSNFFPDNASFEIVTSSFINSDQNFTTAESNLQCIGVFTQCTGVSFLTDLLTGHDAIAINYQDFNGGQSGSTYYYFSGTAFGAAGNYLQDQGSSFNNGSLSVSDVPEPSVWAMLLAGAALMGGALRFQRRQGVGAAFSA
jgi:hypothetical protein